MISPNELVFAVDQDDNPIVPVLRSKAHAEGVWHRISQIWVINKNKQILCQRRSLSKDNNPGKWETFFGGHVAPGESYEEGAVKEVREDLGLSLTLLDLHFFTKVKSEVSKHMQSGFYIIWNGAIADLQIEKEEIEEVVWKDFLEVEKILLMQKSPEWVHVKYEKEMIEYLRNLIV
ncbi:MAG: NUDIX domain-containing protein [Patescibacteria group bacterium]|nr:NUDIX domain-containing protein [Patescibacteria group bacterium]